MARYHGEVVWGEAGAGQGEVSAGWQDAEDDRGSVMNAHLALRYLCFSGEMKWGE